MDRYGATPDEWFTWDVLLGCTSDLLPVVCRPGMPIAKNSALQSYGKVPSQYNSQRHVMGMPAWTSKHATGAEIDRWQNEQDYGICLQTRSFRALDVDVPDPQLAGRIQAFLTFWGERQLFFPIRSRKDSSKFLILFKLVGDYSKQVLKVEHGMIEFLASGQQCLVAGTHPDGARYDWSGLEDGIPTLTVEEWQKLRADFQREFGTAPWTEGRASTPRGTLGAVDLDAVADPVVAYLKEQSLIERVSADGRIHVPCPWQAEHTAGTDPTATTYFPAGTNGFETGNFRCLHGHCESRTVSEFLLRIGYTLSEFEDLTPVESESAVLDALGATDATPNGNIHPLEAPHFERNTKTGKILWTLPNVILALQRPDWSGVLVSWDTYTARLMVIQADGGRRPFSDNDYTQIAMRFYQRLNGFETKTFPLPLIRSAVHQVAEERAYDSAQDWLAALPPWDGVSRVATFCERYLGASSGAYSEAVSRYWWTAHAGRVLVPGVQADMAIVLISQQGTGKTTSIKAMVPDLAHYAELSLADKDADLSRAMMGKMIGELAELRGLSGRESESIKAWVSRTKEEWTPKFMENRKIYLRRLVLVGTSNHEEFLADETGNRRWLPLRVGSEQDREAIARDREQLWAEARVIFQAQGVCWEDAQRLGRGIHSEFETHDPWEAFVSHWLNYPIGSVKPCEREFFTSEEAIIEAIHIDVQKIHFAEKHRMRRVLRALGLNSVVKRVGARTVRGWTAKNVT